MAISGCVFVWFWYLLVFFFSFYSALYIYILSFTIHYLTSLRRWKLTNKLFAQPTHSWGKWVKTDCCCNIQALLLACDITLVRTCRTEAYNSSNNYCRWEKVIKQLQQLFVILPKTVANIGPRSKLYINDIALLCYRLQNVNIACPKAVLLTTSSE